MSFDFNQWIRDANRSTMSFGAGRLAFALLTYFNKDGIAWPTRAELSKDCKCSERAVRRWLAELEECGVIQRHEDEPRVIVGLCRE